MCSFSFVDISIYLPAVFRIDRLDILLVDLNCSHSIQIQGSIGKVVLGFSVSREQQPLYAVYVLSAKWFAYWALFMYVINDL